MIGDPFSTCLREPVSAGCTHNSECAPTESCINTKCQDVCAFNPCAQDADCRASFHRASKETIIFKKEIFLTLFILVCSCPPNWAGDPNVRCYKRKFILLSKTLFN
jgi:hypothetical protein